MGWLSWPYPFLIVWESTPWFDNNAYLPCIHKKNRKGWRNWRPPSSPRWSPRRVWSIKYTGYNYLDFTHTHHKITGFSQTLNSGYVDVSPPSSGLFRASHTEIPQCIVQPGDQKAICHWSRRRMRWCQRMEPIFQRHGCGLSQKGWPRSENFGISGISERNSTLGLKMDRRGALFSDNSSCVFSTIISSFCHFQDVLSYWGVSFSVRIYIRLNHRYRCIHTYHCIILHRNQIIEPPRLEDFIIFSYNLYATQPICGQTGIGVPHLTHFIIE